MVAAITVLSLAPSILVMTTSFVRIVVVMSLLRTAIGLQNAPPNSVVISLSLFLTAFVMAPTFMASYEAGIQPYMAEAITLEEAIPRALGPVQQFMGRHANEADVALFANMANIENLQSAETAPFHVLAPAFMISELKRAFEIGFMVFLPFLVIDLVVSSILMAMGMMMLPPVTISLPFKLIFFVLVDGWRMLAGSLVESFMQSPPS
jgi:flagellar biosynthesis protein FliP